MAALTGRVDPLQRQLPIGIVQRLCFTVSKFASSFLVISYATPTQANFPMTLTDDAGADFGRFDELTSCFEHYRRAFIESAFPFIPSPFAVSYCLALTCRLTAPNNGVTWGII